MKKFLAAALAGALVLSAAPAMAQHHGGGHRHGGWHGHRGGGWGVGAGFAAGALLGGALAQPYYYGPGPYAYEMGPGDGVGYCMQRFKSYDPESGTYLGYDGMRHPCP